MKCIATIALYLSAIATPSEAFTVTPPACKAAAPIVSYRTVASTSSTATADNRHKSSSRYALPADLDTVALVAGQENYGLAVVVVGEALWSFFQAPSVSHAKVLVPASVAAVVLAAVSGPMITSGDASSVALGLEIATGVSTLLGASYVARLVAPYSPSSKEIAFFGLLVAIAGFFSFSQNLVVDGFVTLPTLPSLPFSLPEIRLGLGEDIDTSIP
mmetsp:Transcript_17713/g.37212  ORF Transcript_17713/g.37212 Transcript_17713/m.37212 type:complete len:216 (-) Transcript_17713:286-933(-)|eukprot:CAMPEP_0171365032 /NCGR_PEP_ID=MMETSP0879-20121228/4409_1 /TAXON_ID=67004 /ORGANISM="Thalassiosira weissflogii, Strain CCMP1336" /LENGTH=215 /DNA_ID=CAMNT_0011872525 /DNA_START=54 /DNA_END=701 /DNA_ORIENTATION=+